MFVKAWALLAHITLLDVLDILLIAFMIYYVLLLIRDTKAYQAAAGLALIGALYLLTVWGRLGVSNRIIRSFVNYLIIGIIVLFQAEIRRFLTEIGSRTFRKPLALRSFQEKIDDLFQAIDFLSQKRIGALIAIEKEISLSTYADRGAEVDAVLSKNLLVSIFFPHSPLHDGAAIVKGDRIVAAGCLLPLPAAHRLRSPFQTRTRHLAAIGLSGETDAAVIVISEETGTVSLAIKGQLDRYDDNDVLKKRLLGYLRDR
ncbi:MAG TPA: diadenylate cyclase CdaA [Candidatus Aminicenantes bacterium]|nr:diadenylate cyclase CdaA [Candidatus Aminicenantes bacterium]HRY64602.1 diadenylate cyclase CdaA [Candidatus Aminicenantes bacterium]HRZ71515.1 diadenylate cyclase CdaA [Candidatus Aminicenantes bacterium]